MAGRIAPIGPRGPCRKETTTFHLTSYPMPPAGRWDGTPTKGKVKEDAGGPPPVPSALRPPQVRASTVYPPLAPRKPGTPSSPGSSASSLRWYPRTVQRSQGSDSGSRLLASGSWRAA